MPRDARVCEAKKPTVLLSVDLRLSVLTGGDVADSKKMALNNDGAIASFFERDTAYNISILGRHGRGCSAGVRCICSSFCSGR